MGAYDYYYDYSYAEPAAEGVAGFLVGFVLVFYLLMIALGVVTYVLQSLGMYTIAKRRGIHNPWLAWIPLGNMWILGSIADQYQYVAKGNIRNRRKTLLGLTIAMYALMIPLYVSCFSTIFNAAMGYNGTAILLGTTASIAIICGLVMMVISIIVVVFQYIALYDLFTSCEPGNSVMYLVLSIFISVTLPFFIFACRNKDLGMPPKRMREPEQIPEQPTWQPVLPVEEAAAEEASAGEVPPEA